MTLQRFVTSSLIRTEHCSNNLPMPTNLVVLLLFQCCYTWYSQHTATAIKCVSVKKGELCATLSICKRRWWWWSSSSSFVTIYCLRFYTAWWTKLQWCLRTKWKHYMRATIVGFRHSLAKNTEWKGEWDRPRILGTQKTLFCVP